MKKLKKRLLWILFIAIWCVFGVDGLDASVVYAETEGDWEYTILEDGTVEITNYTGSATEVVVPDVIAGMKVTSLGSYSLSYKEFVTITLPNGLINIGNGAFEYSDIESISLPNTVTSVGEGVFSDSYGLREVTLSTAMTEIPKNMFR